MRIGAQLLQLFFMVVMAQVAYANGKDSACEGAAAAPRVVAIDSQHLVTLDSSQTLVRGVLNSKQIPGILEQELWLVEYARLSDGDQIFILDTKGQVVVKGYFGEKDGKPVLYKDPNLQNIRVRGHMFKAFFKNHNRVAAIVKVIPAID